MHPRRLNVLWTFLLLLGLFRLATLGAYPLMDTTEARYGEMARIMAETGNWLVPQIDYGKPFWGKPPLSFWAGAASISLFGNSEFFLRLPHFLAALATLLICWQFTRALGCGRREASIAIAVIASTIGFIVTAGAVMTDMFLTLSLTLALTGFWRGWHGERGQVYLMYAGLGLGLLAKGPLVLVLAGLAILPWILATAGPVAAWREIYRRLHLFSGILLMLAIALPWYLLMERASPGFLEYFIVGEHFKRFFVSGWQGDLYGSAHARPRGTIWLFWLFFAMPWSLALAGAAIAAARRRRFERLRDPLILFLLLWMCSPMLLFTFAGNILPAYIAPGLPALGPLIVLLFDPAQVRRGRHLLLVGPALMLAVGLVVLLRAADEYSDKGLLHRGIDRPYPVFYDARLPDSARYYSDGQAIATDGLPQAGQFYFVTAKKNAAGVEETGLCTERARNYSRILYVCDLGRKS